MQGIRRSERGDSLSGYRALATRMTQQFLIDCPSQQKLILLRTLNTSRVSIQSRNLILKSFSSMSNLREVEDRQESARRLTIAGGNNANSHQLNGQAPTERVATRPGAPALGREVLIPSWISLRNFFGLTTPVLPHLT